MREFNVTDATDSILYNILMNDPATVSTSMANTIHNESTSTTYVELMQENENNQRLWNLSKTAVTSLSEPTAIPFNTSKSTTIYTTTESFDEFGPPEGVEYIFVPLGVVVSVLILSAVVWVAISLLSLPCDVFSPAPFLFHRCSAAQIREYTAHVTYCPKHAYICSGVLLYSEFRLTEIAYNRAVPANIFLWQSFTSCFSC